MNDNSGPAFPSKRQQDPYRNAQVLDPAGLTKRELFAAMAMQGMLSSWPADSKFYPEHTAQRAIEFADALIAELAK